MPTRFASAELLFVSMPFGLLFRPSLGIGLLQAALRERGIACAARFFTLDYAARVGVDRYLEVASGRPMTQDLEGEWIFSGELAAQSEAQVQAYIDDVLRGVAAGHRHGSKPHSDELVDALLGLRAEAGVFLDACLAEILERAPRVVGFSSLFQQQTASLALARRIKAHAPEVTILFGGANCEGPMGRQLARSFPFVDVVVSGEGDVVVPELVERLLEGRPLDGIAGARSVERIGDAQVVAAAPVRDLDALPIPDYRDFFEQIANAPLDAWSRACILFETSRGCWWGERHHCSFCGLNGADMGFRRKRADRVLEELRFFDSEYAGADLAAVDNILDPRFFEDLIPALARRPLGAELFFEVKANLTRVQLERLHDAGIHAIQPGIESLSDAVLRGMDKGVTGLQSLQLLKWCKELGIEPIWAIIWGFPGEPPEEYARIAAWMPWLHHLPPPSSAGPLRLDRFSPNFERARERGFTDVEALPAYRHVYGLDASALRELAYYFDFDYATPVDVEAYTTPLLDATLDWSASHPWSDLFFVESFGRAIVWDLRACAVSRLTMLDPDASRVLVACDRVRALPGLRRELEATTGGVWSEAKLEQVLGPLAERGFVLRDVDHCLGLALRVGRYSPRASIRRWVAKRRSGLHERFRPWRPLATSSPSD